MTIPRLHNIRVGLPYSNNELLAILMFNGQTHCSDALLYTLAINIGIAIATNSNYNVR